MSVTTRKTNNGVSNRQKGARKVSVWVSADARCEAVGRRVSVNGRLTAWLLTGGGRLTNRGAGVCGRVSAKLSTIDRWVVNLL